MLMLRGCALAVAVAVVAIAMPQARHVLRRKAMIPLNISPPSYFLKALAQRVAVPPLLRKVMCFP